MMVLLILLALGPGMRAGDVPVRPDALAGQVLEFYSGGTAEYGQDHSYAFQQDTVTHHGQWRGTAAGQVCVAFEGGFERCDRYVMAAGRWVLIDGAGHRFPVRRHLGREPPIP